MTRTVHFQDIQTSSHVLRERANATSLVVWLSQGISNGYRDWNRILTVSQTSIPVGQLHVIPAAICLVPKEFHQAGCQASWSDGDGGSRWN